MAQPLFAPRLCAGGIDPSDGYDMTRLPDPDARPEFYDGVPTKRLLAWLIDVLAIGVVSVVIVPFTAFTAIFYFPALMVVVGFAYRVATLARWSATPGMALMAIELRDARDRRFDLGHALLHTTGYAVSLAAFPLQLISVVLMAAQPSGQGLTDMVLGSAALNRRRGRQT